MKTSINRLFIAFAFGIGFFSWQSCKEQTATKTGMIPPVDNINTFALPVDSLNASLQIGINDSVQTNISNIQSSPVVALGLIPSDPFFGSMNAGLYLQVAPAVTNFSFPSSAEYTFDSAVLSIPYADVSFGDTTNPSANIQSFNVYRVTDPLSVDDSTAYTFSDFSFNPTAIGSANVSLKNIQDSFAVGTDTVSDQLHIKLNTAYIFSTIVQLDSATLSSSRTFMDYFHGLYIQPNTAFPSQNRISYFVLAGSDALHTARIDFYFHKNSDNTQRVSSFVFRLGNTAYFNRIKRDDNNTPSASFVAHPNNRDSVLAQGAPGFYTDITLHHLNKLPACIVNKAELVITALPDQNQTLYQPPIHLILERVNSDGSVSPIADVLSSSGSASAGGLNFMDGSPETVAINGQDYTQYHLNFPRELQKTLMAGEDSMTLRIAASSSYIGAFRLVAPGFNETSDTKMQLNIIYTKTH